KITFLLLSFLLFALPTYPLFGAAEDVLDPVVDIAGEDLQTDALYYVLPYIWALGGGVGLGRNWNGSICPFSVVQSPFEVNDGSPVRFSPILDEDSVVRVSTDIDISFVRAPKLCSDLPIWQISDLFVTLGGTGGSIIDRFRIVKHNVSPFMQTYKIVFCKARRACQNIGIFNKNGIRYLALSGEPYIVVFKKDQLSQI
ncbi:Kunitz family serine protease inhibitor, partial [Acinetobacter indicus]|uniref:Kunitz family serine protease inhibitor n=1 Tax=Acinetobacter indicus TaxID=756892 RepID=UPI0014441FCC